MYWQAFTLTPLTYIRAHTHRRYTHSIPIWSKWWLPAKSLTKSKGVYSCVCVCVSRPTLVFLVQMCDARGPSPQTPTKNIIHKYLLPQSTKPAVSSNKTTSKGFDFDGDSEASVNISPAYFVQLIWHEWKISFYHAGVDLSSRRINTMEHKYNSSLC